MRLPPDYPKLQCSHRTPLALSLVNDIWVSVTSGSEDYSFKVSQPMHMDTFCCERCPALGLAQASSSSCCWFIGVWGDGCMLVAMRQQHAAPFVSCCACSMLFMPGGMANVLWWHCAFHLYCDWV